MDFAEQMRWLVDEAYPDARAVRVALDNLNTHKMGSLYEAYEPVEARRIARRLEFHYTPKHGSWLNMAEIELSVFSKHCLRGTSGERNDAGAVIHWRFTTRNEIEPEMPKYLPL